MAPQTRSTAVRSAADSRMSFGGRGTPLSCHSGPPTSPKPSAYGVSPTTTTPTSVFAIGAEAVAL